MHNIYKINDILLSIALYVINIKFLVGIPNVFDVFVRVTLCNV